MDLAEYQNLCARSAAKYDDQEKEIMVLGLGIAGEAGDVAGCVKKTIGHKDEQIAGIKENLGDTAWYIAMICNHYGWSMDEVLTENIDKLKKRYPKGFTAEDAQASKHRDWNE